MTTVQINKSGQDQVTLSLMQTGSNETSVNLRYNLLDDRLSYMFGVDSLSVPLNNAPISPVTVDTELFSVLRRDVGVWGDDADLSTAFDSRFRTSPNDKHFDVSGFARSLANWARAFNAQQSLEGLVDLRQYGGPSDAADPAAAEVAPLEILPAKTQAELDADGAYNFLSVQVTPDGKLQITGTPNFFNNFIFSMDFTVFNYF